MQFERRVVLIDLVHEELRVVAARREDFHLHGPGFVFQATLHMRPEGGHELSLAPRRQVDRSDECDLGHACPAQGAGRSCLNAARNSAAKSSGCSHAAKWPPLSTSWK